MNEEKIYNIVSGIDEELLNRSLNCKKYRHPKTYYKWGIVAACLAFIAVISSTALTLAAEAKEYNTALNFFAQNGLSFEGLSRSDVKEVYRDITQKKFTYEKTEEVICRGVSGMEIEQRWLTPEELAALWDERNNNRVQNRNGIRFDSEFIYKTDTHIVMDADKWVLHCYRYDELLWSAEFTDFYGEGQLYTENGTVVWGGNWFHSSNDPRYSYLALVNDEGKIQWQRRLDHGFKYEYIYSVLQNQDGTFEIFSIGDFSDLCLSRFSPYGKEISFCNTGLNCGCKKAAHFGDGYIIQGGKADLIRLDKNGKLIDKFTYEADDCSYYLTDMIEYAGQIYLSGYAVPPQQYSSLRGENDDIANVLGYIISNELWDISSEELMPMIQNSYTAVLLLCDPKSGTPQTFYSVKSSLGNALSVNEAGQLEWRVESIASIHISSPYTSSYTFGGVSEVFIYTFDSDGTLIGETDTGKTTPFRR